MAAAAATAASDHKVKSVQTLLNMLAHSQYWTVGDAGAAKAAVVDLGRTLAAAIVQEAEKTVTSTPPTPPTQSAEHAQLEAHADYTNREANTAVTADAAAERQAAGHSMMADWIVCLGLVCTSLGFEWAYEHVAQTHLWPLLAQWSETLPPAHGVSGGGGGASGDPPTTQQEGREQDRLGLARRAEAFGHIFALLGTIGAAGIGLGSAGTGTDDGVAMLRGVLEGTMQQHLDGDQTFGMPIGIGLARALLRFAAKTNDAEEKTRLGAIPLQWAKMLSRHEWEAELPRDLKLRLAGSRLATIISV